MRVGYGDGAERIMLGQWFASGGLVVDWALRVDTLTAVMLVVVNSVSSLVHLYSIGYMLVTFAALALDRTVFA
jgi:NADH-quinone oxidoreductase subunit L